MKWFELLMPVLNVLYVVIAVVMTGLILMQRGSGAQAGSGFGSGASGTVFGARGSANFLSRATAVCAVLFFVISIGMGMFVSHGGRVAPEVGAGIMSGFSEAAGPAVPLKSGELPSPATTVPVVVPNTTPPQAPPVPATIPDAQTAVPASDAPAVGEIKPAVTPLPVEQQAPAPASDPK